MDLFGDKNIYGFCFDSELVTANPPLIIYLTIFNTNLLMNGKLMNKFNFFQTKL